MRADRGPSSRYEAKTTNKANTPYKSITHIINNISIKHKKNISRTPGVKQNTYIPIYVYTYICIYIYIYTSLSLSVICVCVYIYIYIKTYTNNDK